VYRHLNPAGGVLGHQLEIVPGLRRLLVGLAQPVPLRAVGIKVAGARSFAAGPANGDDGRALGLCECALGSASA
jgi:hypothetical protein